MRVGKRNLITNKTKQIKYLKSLLVTEEEVMSKWCTCEAFKIYTEWLL